MILRNDYLQYDTHSPDTSQNFIKYYEKYQSSLADNSESLDDQITFKDNFYVSNYAGVTSAIVQLWGPFKVKMSGDGFISNLGIHTEAVKSFGAINPI